MIFDLPTDERKPLFGAAGAKLGLRQVGLEADDAILTFRPRNVCARIVARSQFSFASFAACWSFATRLWSTGAPSPPTELGADGAD